MLAALWRYWQFRGHVPRGRDNGPVLAMPGADPPTRWRMRALEAAGGLGWWAGDVPGADAHYAQQVRIARAVGDPRAIADALFNYMHTQFRPDGPEMELIALRDEARRLYRELGEERSLARLHWIMGYVHMAAGDFAGAREIVETSLGRFERNGDDFYVALAATGLAGIDVAEGKLADAFARGLRGLHLQDRMGDTASATLGLRAGAMLLLVAGKLDEAAVAMGAYVAHARRLGYRPPLDVESWLQVGFSAAQLDAALAGPELAGARARGAEMSIPEVLAFLEDVRARGELPAIVDVAVPDGSPG